MKYFGRSLLNPPPAAVPGTFATETSPGEPPSTAMPFSSSRLDRNGDGMVGQGEFCLLDGKKPASRKARVKQGRS